MTPEAVGGTAVMDEPAGQLSSETMHIFIEYEDFLGADQLGSLLNSLSDLYHALAVPEETLAEPAEGVPEPPPLRVASIHSGNSITIIVAGGAALAAAGPVGWTIGGVTAVGGVAAWILKRRIDLKKAEKLESEAEAERQRATAERERGEAERKRAEVYEADADLKRAEADLTRQKAKLAKARAEQIESSLGKKQKAKADQAAEELERTLDRSPNIRRVSINDQDLDLPSAA